MQASSRIDSEHLLERLEALVAALLPPNSTRDLRTLLAVLAVPELTTAALNQGLLAHPVEEHRLLSVQDHDLIRLAPQVRALAAQSGFSAMKELALRLHQALPLRAL